MSRGVQTQEATHAVTDNGDLGRVAAIFLGVFRISQESNRCLRVFDGVAERKRSGAAPGAAIVRNQDVPAGAPDGVSEIHVLLVAGKAVQQQDDRMRTRARTPGRRRR